MKIYTFIPTDLPPTALTIGTFDGVHRGHRALLKRLREVSPHSTVLTFTNHPLETLNPNQAPTLLTSLPEKLALLEECRIDVVIAIPFTRELADLAYDTFLEPFPLTHLILGAGDAFGKNREGNEANLAALGKARGFTVEFIAKELFDGKPVSSRRIREALAAHDTHLATQLLGKNPL